MLIRIFTLTSLFFVLFNYNGILLPSELIATYSAVPSLKRLCCNKIDELASSESFEILEKCRLTVSAAAQLPQDLNEKIMKYKFFTKHAVILSDDDKGYYTDFFDEEHDRIMLKKRGTSSSELKILDLNNGKTNLLCPGNYRYHCSSKDRSLVLAHHQEEDKITIIRDWGKEICIIDCPTGLGRCQLFSNNFYKDAQEIIFRNCENAQSCLFNITDGTIKYQQSKEIKTDNCNRFYLVSKDGITTLYKKTSSTSHEPIHVFQDSRNMNFTFNPNGQQLFVSDSAKKICQLISFKKSIIKIINVSHCAESIEFNSAGEYALLSHNSQENGTLMFSVIDTTSGTTYIQFKVSEKGGVLTNFDKNNLIITRLADDENSCEIYRLPIKKICFLSHSYKNVILAFDGLLSNNSATMLQTTDMLMYDSTPTEEYVTMHTDYTLTVTHIKSKKVALTLPDIVFFSFDPTGKVLFVSDIHGVEKILLLDNNLTVSNCLLQRFMAENNVKS